MLSGVGHDAFEVVFVDDGGNGFLALLVETADDASGAVDKNVSIGADDEGREHDAKVDDRPHREFGIHVKQHATGGDVGSFSKILVSIAGADGYRKLQGKPYCTS
jgi:hypothetical protein